jgi:hypothetical protein
MAHLNFSFTLFLSIGFLSFSSGLALGAEATSIGSSAVQSAAPYRGDFAGLARQLDLSWSIFPPLRLLNRLARNPQPHCEEAVARLEK